MSIYKDGMPDSDRRVLAYSSEYTGDPTLEYRILDGQFVPRCYDITHYVYVHPPKQSEVTK